MPPAAKANRLVFAAWISVKNAMANYVTHIVLPNSHLTDPSDMGSLVPPAGRRSLRLLPPEAAHGRGGGGGEERRRRRRRRLRLRDAAGEDRGGESGLRRHRGIQGL